MRPFLSPFKTPSSPVLSSCTAGGRYRFRFVDGHWHAGLVVALHHMESRYPPAVASATAAAGPAAAAAAAAAAVPSGAAPRQTAPTAGAHTEAVVRFLHPTQHQMLGGVQLPASALQPDHGRAHDLTRLRPGDVVFAQLIRSDATAGGCSSTADEADAADGSQPDAEQLWEEVNILSFQHGGRSVEVAAAADPSRQASLAVDDVILTPWVESSGSEGDEESEEEEAYGELDEIEGGAAGGEQATRGAPEQQDSSWQQLPGNPATGIPPDSDAEPDPARLAHAEAARAEAADAVSMAAAAGRQTQTAIFTEWEVGNAGWRISQSCRTAAMLVPVRCMRQLRD